MADTAIVTVPLNKDVSYRQSQMPFYVYGEFTADDTAYHALKVDGRGKGRLTVAVDNPTNKSVTITFYGMHSSTGEVGDTGVFAIPGAGLTVAATSSGYETINDPFPYYLIREKFSDSADSKTVTTYVNFQAF